MDTLTVLKNPFNALLKHSPGRYTKSICDNLNALSNSLSLSRYHKVTFSKTFNCFISGSFMAVMIAVLKQLSRLVRENRIMSILLRQQISVFIGQDLSEEDIAALVDATIDDEYVTLEVLEIFLMSYLLVHQFIDEGIQIVVQWEVFMKHRASQMVSFIRGEVAEMKGVRDEVNEEDTMYLRSTFRCRMLHKWMRVIFQTDLMDRIAEKGLMKPIYDYYFGEGSKKRIVDWLMNPRGNEQQLYQLFTAVMDFSKMQLLPEILYHEKSEVDMFLQEMLFTDARPSKPGSPN